MSAIADTAIVNPDSKNGGNEALGQGQPARSAAHKNYKGFVAGVFSGVSKLSGMIYLPSMLVSSLNCSSGTPVCILYSVIQVRTNMNQL